MSGWTTSWAPRREAELDARRFVPLNGVMNSRRQIILGASAVACLSAGATRASPAATDRVEFRHGDSWLRLRIAGYQFPEARGDDDANWLMIEGECSLNDRSWRFTDPCLETWEAEDLATWLEAVAAGRAVPPDKVFTEPNLEFHLVGGKMLRIVFSLESAPPWAGIDSPVAQRSFVMPAAASLLPAAKVLRQQLRLFPSRAARPTG